MITSNRRGFQRKGSKVWHRQLVKWMLLLRGSSTLRMRWKDDSVRRLKLREGQVSAAREDSGSVEARCAAVVQAWKERWQRVWSLWCERWSTTEVELDCTFLPPWSSTYSIWAYRCQKSTLWFPCHRDRRLRGRGLLQNPGVIVWSNVWR